VHLFLYRCQNFNISNNHFFFSKFSSSVPLNFSNKISRLSCICFVKSLNWFQIRSRFSLETPDVFFPNPASLVILWKLCHALLTIPQHGNNFLFWSRLCLKSKSLASLSRCNSRKVLHEMIILWIGPAFFHLSLKSLKCFKVSLMFLRINQLFQFLDYS
jgi:hypothetical protein